MIRPHVTLYASLALLIFAVLVSAKDACCPTDGQAKPAAAAAAAPQTPPHAALPEGHPPIAGHGADPTQVVKGTLVIKATQATPGGAAIGELPVKVTLQSKTQPAQTIDTRLDAHGIVMLEDVEFRGIVHPVVAVTHGGITYETTGKPMYAGQAEQILRVNVYEATDERPAWTVTNRQVFVQPGEAGLTVHEWLTLANPSDRAWTGIEIPTTENHAGPRRIITTVALPEGATDLHVMQAPQVAWIEAGRLAVGGPLIPGTAELRYRYQIPADKAAAWVPFVAPAPTQKLSLFVPDDGREITAEGLSAGESLQSHGQPIRAYHAAELGPDAAVRVKVGPRATKAAVAPAAPPAADEPGLESANPAVKTVAMVGGLLIILTGLSLFAKRPAAHRPARA